MFLREKTGNYYTTASYFMSQFLCDILPLRVVPPIIFSCISYWMIGLRSDAAAFLNFTFILIITNTVAVSLCLMISSAATNVGQANFVTVLLMIFCFLFTGLLINTTQGAPSVLKYFSFLHFAWEALCANEFTDLNLIFSPEGFPVTRVKGDVVLRTFGLYVSNMNLDIGLLFAWAAGFSIVGICFMLYFSGRYQSGAKK